MFQVKYSIIYYIYVVIINITRLSITFRYKIDEYKEERIKMKKNFEVIVNGNNVMEIAFLGSQNDGVVKTKLSSNTIDDLGMAEIINNLFDHTVTGNSDTPVTVLGVLCEDKGSRVVSVIYDNAWKALLEETDLGVNIILDPSEKDKWPLFFKKFEEEMGKTPVESIISKKEWD